MSTKNKEIKEITDIDLDTGTNLVTENYQLEILGLKDLVDLRKFSRSFLKVDKLLKSIFTGKEDKINKKSAFNKEFGVAQNEVLEGNKLAEILGIEYGGILNNTNAKVAGKGYYDTANKKIYKCTTNTSINYADAGYFIEVSNNDLLGKLQNLVTPINVEHLITLLVPEVETVYSAVISSSILFISIRLGNVKEFRNTPILEVNLSSTIYEVPNSRIRSNTNYPDSNFDFVNSTKDIVRVNFWSNTGVSKLAVQYANIVFPLKVKLR